MNVQSPWLSPVFWGAVATNIIGMFSAMGFWDWIGVSDSVVTKVVGFALAIFALIVGAYNNPTNKIGWGANVPPQE